MERLMLVDGHSLMHRAYYAMGNTNLTTPDGRPSGAVYNFYNILLRYLREYEPTELLIAFDLPGPTFRHEIYDEYKAGRSPMPDDLRAQFPMLRESLAAAGIGIVEMPGYEADDLIGMFSKTAGPEREVYILSGDRDTLQLVNEHVTQILPQNRGRTTVYTPATVEEMHGVRPDQFVELKALMGDSSDNIPGVKGIGVKTATRLLQKYGDIEALYEHLEELPGGQRAKLSEGREALELSRTLASIQCKSPKELQPERYRFAGFSDRSGELYERFKTYGFEQLIRRMELEADGPERASEEASAKEMPGAEQNRFRPQHLEGKEAETALRETLCRIAGDTTALALWRTEPDSGAYHLILRDEFKPATSFDAPSDPSARNETKREAGEIIYRLTAEATRRILEQAQSKHIPLVSIHSKEIYKDLAYFPPAGVFDVEVAAYILGSVGSERSIQALAELLPAEDERYQRLLEKVTEASREEQLRDELARYLEGQTLHCLRHYLEREIRKNKAERLCYEIEMPLIGVLARMEERGILVDADLLDALAEDFTFRLEELEAAIYEEAGRPFKINSPKQLAELLFEERGLPPGRKTAGGAYSTDADELDRLRAMDPLVELILDYRRIGKFLNTSVRGLTDALGKDGRVHTRFHQTLTQTGRLSSSDPNLQNIPVREEEGREIRRVFIAEEGWQLLDADYSQIELRLLAALSKDERMLEAFQRKGDIHRETASSVFHVHEEEVTAEQRAKGKTINFSIIYGISAFGLARNLHVSRQEAQSYIDRYYERYPGVRQFMKKAIEGAKETGYVDTLFGRRRYIPELKSRNYNRRQFGERVAMNTPIQGTAADIMKAAMVRVAEELERRGKKARPVLQIHDELIIEAPNDEVEEVSRILQEAMEGAADTAVPLVAEVIAGDNWLDVK